MFCHYSSVELFFNNAEELMSTSFSKYYSIFEKKLLKYVTISISVYLISRFYFWRFRKCFTFVNVDIVFFKQNTLYVPRPAEILSL